MKKAFLLVTTLFMFSSLFALDQSFWAGYFNNCFIKGKLESTEKGSSYITTDKLAIYVSHLASYQKAFDSAPKFAENFKKSPAIAFFIDGVKDSLAMFEKASTIAQEKKIQIWLINNNHISDSSKCWVEVFKADPMVSLEKGTLKYNKASLIAPEPTKASTKSNKKEVVTEEEGEGEESSVSEVEKVQCSGTTKNGNQCKRMTASPNGKCYQHGGD